MDPSLQPLLDRLDHLSDEFSEVREGVHKAILVADLDPEMALTRSRKVLELVVRELYQRRIKEPPGTRPLENLIQRLVKDGFFPDRMDAYATTVRKLGNVGTHTFGETITVADVQRSLSHLQPILEWYFERERPDALAAGPVKRDQELTLRQKAAFAGRTRERPDNGQPSMLAVTSAADCPPGYVPILYAADPGNSLGMRDVDNLAARGFQHLGPLPHHLRLLAVDCRQYASFQELLDELYTLNLRGRYPLYTYGSHWVLAKPDSYVSLLALPWEWLHHKRSRRLADVIPGYYDHSSSVSEHGFGENANHTNPPVWAIIDRDFEKEAFGLFLSDEESGDRVFRKMMDAWQKGLYFSFVTACFNPDHDPGHELVRGVSRLVEIDPSLYRRKFVVVAPDLRIELSELPEELAPFLPEDAVFFA